MQANNKLREALVVIRRDLWDLMGSASESLRESLACKINATIRAALAEPPRNCDIGTAEEQIKRFYDEYYAKDSKCKRMWSFGECAIEWAQMPYEEGGAR